MFDAIVAGKSTRDALLAATYHSERRTFTLRVVTKALNRTGLLYLDIKVVLARAHLNLGVATGGETARNHARVMATKTIAAVLERSFKVSAGISNGTISVQRAAVYSSYSLRAAARKRTAEQKKEAAQRRARKIAWMENNIAKVKSIEEAAAARMLRTCLTCAISRLQGAGGVDGMSLRQVACVCEVQGPVFHFRIGSDEHEEPSSPNISSHLTSRPVTAWHRSWPASLPLCPLSPRQG